MSNTISTTNFTTVDGLLITIDQYDGYTIYSAIDQNAKTFKITIRDIGKQFTVQPHFYYEFADKDGFTVYSEVDRKKKHLGAICMSKTIPNIDDAEFIAIDAIRKVARLSTPLNVSINEIQNTILQIKTKPNSEKIPYLLDIIQTQLNYLKSKYC